LEYRLEVASFCESSLTRSEPMGINIIDMLYSPPGMKSFRASGISRAAVSAMEANFLSYEMMAFGRRS
jgi:hypothetical protein